MNFLIFSYVEVDLKLTLPVDFSIDSSIIDNNVQASPHIETLDKGFFKIGMRGNIDSHELDFILAESCSQFNGLLLPFLMANEILRWLRGNFHLRWDLPCN